MAYVIARKDGRFEIREALHTERGPRARTLANFAVLTNSVLRTAEGRAQRRFDAPSVLASAIRRGVPLGDDLSRPFAPTSRSGFVEAARRFGQAIDPSVQPTVSKDPGTALVELIQFAEEVQLHLPRRAVEPLHFPSLLRLREGRGRE